MSSERGQVLLHGVSKVYEGERRALRLRDAIPRSRLRPRQPTVAIDEAALEVARGETLGIVGGNGAGKSTLLKLVAGITRPTTGSVRVVGRIGSMIELGLGFHVELTGWENIECSARVLGLTRGEVARIAPAIAEFSGLVDALDEPLRTYSLGMRARLGFAVATQVDADVLLVDEVLAVGDAAFQQRCLARIAELAADGVTVLFVSHDMSLIHTVCTRAIRLHHGRIVDEGAAIDVVDRYLSRSTRSYRPSGDQPLAFTRFDLSPDQIESWEPIRIEAEVVVSRPLGSAEITIELARLVEEPEPPFGIATSVVPGLHQPGRYRLVGTSNPYPGGPGAIAVTTSLLDGARRELSDQRDSVLRVPGIGPAGNVHLAVQPHFTIESVTGPHDRSGADATTPQHWGEAPVAATMRGVTKRFAGSGIGPRARLAVPGRAGRQPERDHVALDEVTLDIHAGTALGVVGTNGAGKSTLLRLLAGITRPDEGELRTHGRVVAVLDLGLGFHPHLTGFQNLAASARMLGLDDSELAQRTDAIIDFAGLGDVMDQPVNHYSTGMRARLGLALALHTDPDILLIDELLAVGDREFRRKALDRVRRVRDDGAAVVMVSHGLRLIEEVCDRVVRLHDGRVVDDGLPADVIERYGGIQSVHGATDAGTGIRVHELTLRRQRVPVDGTIEFKGMVEVAVGSPHARLELTYRAQRSDRDAVTNAVELANLTFYRATLEPSGGRLGRPGWYSFTGEIADNAVQGGFDVVISVFDERDHVTLSESWQEASVGDGDQGPGWAFRFEWEISEAVREERTA